MTTNAILQIGVFLATLLVGAFPLGLFMARIYRGDVPKSFAFLTPIERLIYRLCRLRADGQMTWKQYTMSVMWLSIVSLVVVYAIQ